VHKLNYYLMFLKAMRAAMHASTAFVVIYVLLQIDDFNLVLITAAHFLYKFVVDELIKDEEASKAKRRVLNR
jgi:hypothetical protein